MIPIISVIIPVYNQEKFIGRCLRSIINQSIKAEFFEIIVVNDNSTDSTSELLSAFNNSQIRIFNNETNKGLPFSLNLGIRKSVGKFVVRLDSDDYVHTDYLKFLYRALEMNPEFDAVCCDYLLIDKKENVLKKVNSNEEPIGCGIMFRESQMIEIGLYNNDQLYNEEKEFRYRFEKKYNIERIPFPLYRYRRHESNMTNDSEKMKFYTKKLKDERG